MSSSRSKKQQQQQQGSGTSSSLTRHKDRHAVHETLVKRREEGWNSSTVGGLPKYDVAKDKNCPMAINRHFNVQQKRLEQERLQRVMSQDSSKWVKQNISNRFSEVPEIMYNSADVEASHYQQSTQAGFAIPPQHIPSMHAQADVPDTAILHKIVVRENLIMEIKKLLEHQQDFDTIRNEVLELVRAVRYETVEIVLGIKEWRKGQMFVPKEFLFKGKNYLIKINSDLDFLDGVDDLGLGFPIAGNPLVFPYYNGQAAPQPLRIGTNSALPSYDPKSGVFMSNNSQINRRDVYVEQMNIDGIDIRTLVECDQFIRDEIALRSNKKLLDSLHQQQSQMSVRQGQQQQHHHNQQYQQQSQVLGVGERGMLDSIMMSPGGGAGKGGHQHAPSQHHVSFMEGQYNQSSVVDPRGSVSFDDQPIGFEPSESFVGGKSRVDNSFKQPSMSVPTSNKLLIQQSKSGAPSVRPSQANQMRVRMDTMAEEIEVLRVMMAHVADKVEYKTKEESELFQIRSMMENRWKQAVAQNKSVKASELAIKLSVMDNEIDGVKHDIKDLNRQIFFFDLEIKRKRKMISKLRNDIEKSRRIAKLKRELNARMANNENILSALELEDEGEEDAERGTRLVESHHEAYDRRREAAAGGERHHARGNDVEDAPNDQDDNDDGGDGRESAEPYDANNEDNEFASSYEGGTMADDDGDGGDKNDDMMGEQYDENGSGEIQNDLAEEEREYSNLDPSYYENVDDPGEGYGDESDVVLSLSQKHLDWRQEMEAVAVAKRAEEEAWAEAERALAERRAAEAAMAVEAQKEDAEEETEERKTDDIEEYVSPVPVAEEKSTEVRESTILPVPGGAVAGSGLAVARSVRDSSREQHRDGYSHRSEYSSHSQDPIASQAPVPVSIPQPKADVGASDEAVQNTSGKTYNSVVKGQDYKSFLAHKGDVVEIHCTNCTTGENRVIPLMPMLAKQVPTLSEARISGMITDILKALL